jgi:hypothetical protein
MKYKTSPELRPPPHIYGDSYERTSDPWHRNAFPRGLEWAAPNQGDVRRCGWMATDTWGNPIGFVPDGTEVTATPTQIREMEQDMRDRLMGMGTDEAIKHGVYDRESSEEGREGA